MQQEEGLLRVKTPSLCYRLGPAQRTSFGLDVSFAHTDAILLGARRNLTHTHLSRRVLVHPARSGTR